MFPVPKVAPIELKRHHLRQASFYPECNKPKEIFISKGKHTIISGPDNDRRNDVTVSVMGSSQTSSSVKWDLTFRLVVKDFAEVFNGLLLLNVHLVWQHYAFALTEKPLGL